MPAALYRKYRPQVFDDVIGQEHIERTLKNAIRSDKVAHAYLFCGPRGTGKTTTARLLAKALLCEGGPTPDPDGTCAQCQAIAEGIHPDVYELDAASRTGVENVREEIINRVQFAPTLGRYKIYIIDEVHMLSTAAFNALLKTLEEPPTHVVFILCTTVPQKVPDTIQSRCQRFDFHRISAEAIVTRLGAICVAEGVPFDGAALDLIAHRAEGGMRDALTSLEQLIAFGEGAVTLEAAERMLGSLDVNDMAEIVAAIGARDIATCFTWTADYVETGADLAQFVGDLAQHIRNLYVLALSDGDAVLEVNEVVRRELAHEMPLFGADRLTRMLDILGRLSAEMRSTLNPRLSFEIALTRMVRPDSDLTLEALAERVESLEARLSQATTAGAGLPYAAGAAGKAEEARQDREAPVAPEMRREQEAPHAEEARGVQMAPAAPEPEWEQVAPAPEKSREGTSAPAASSPESQKEAAAAASLRGGLENPAAFQRVWQAALQTIKKNNPAYGALFLTVKAGYDSQGGQVVLEFPAENKFTYTAVQKPEVAATVEEAFQQAAGKPVAFRFAQATAPQAQGVQAMPQVKPPAAPQAQPEPDIVHVSQQVKEPQAAPNGYETDQPNQAVHVAAKGDDMGDRVKALLAETYGEGLVFEVVEEEEGVNYMAYDYNYEDVFGNEADNLDS
ncbi:MAG: DNA polymerase III subunit gamma/tau [Eggerthellaceae bacterium]|nr:DNA polymerase III subunit gamma/tau [Eggerthellaceae bacterium]